MSGFDLSSILQDAAQGAGMFTELAAKTTQNTEAMSAITAVMVDQANTAKGAAENIAETVGQAKMKTQQANLKIANTMGTNASDSGWLIGDMGRRVIEADKKAQAKLADIEAKQSVTFFDNPLGYLYAQATVDGDIAEHNAAVRASDLAKDTAQKLETMSQAGFLTQNAIEQTVTESTINSSKILEGYKYSKDASLAALDGLRNNLQGMQAAANASAAAIDLKFKGLNAVNQQAQLGIAYANLALSKERFNLEAEAKKEKMNVDSFSAKILGLGLRNLGRDTEMEGPKGKEALLLLKANEPTMKAAFDSGLQSYLSGGAAVVSTSPFDASTMYGSGIVKGRSEAQNQTGQYLIEARQAWQKTADGQGAIASKDKTIAERSFNEFIRKTSTPQAQTGQGLYAPAALETVAKQNPNMAALPVWQKVLAPMAATGVKLDNPDMVLGAVTAAVKAGTLSYNDALGVQTMYAAGVNLNNMSRNWMAVGLPLGTGYVAPVSSGGLFGKTPVDLANKEAVARVLNIRMSAATIKTGIGKNAGVLGFGG